MRRRVGSPEPPSDDQAEEADLAVAHAGGGLGDVGDIVASAPQARYHLPFNALVGEYPQASAAGFLAEYAENLAGEREGPLDSGQAPREGRHHSSPASSVRAASASRRGGTSEPLSSRIACIARCSDTSAARTFSATASRAGDSASSRKWRRGGASVLSSSSE